MLAAWFAWSSFSRISLANVMTSSAMCASSRSCLLRTATAAFTGLPVCEDTRKPQAVTLVVFLGFSNSLSYPLPSLFVRAYMFALLIVTFGSHVWVFFCIFAILLFNLFIILLFGYA